MSIYLIEGGTPIFGEVAVQGAKNSALPILAATVLAPGVSEINRCPRLRDVENTLEILRALGCTADRAGERVTVDAAGLNASVIPDRLMREMRSSVIFLGAVLARTGEATLSAPGGCEIGLRPIDLHLAALSQLGAEIRCEGAEIRCRAERLRGCDINLTFPSVGATENTMLAATAAEGVTRIHNPAREPEICDLQAFLQAMGAKVSGAGSMTIEIEGGAALHGACHRVCPDRIAAVTYLAAAAAAGGEVTVTGVRPRHFSAVSAVLREAGCGLRETGDSVTLRRDGRLRAVHPVRTMPYPGFPTDAQAVLMSALAAAEGSTLFVENIFENRYRHVGELRRMGADIRTEGRVALVSGVERLCGAPVRATDLRGGAALACAALGAEGTTELSGVELIRRGYEDLAGTLASLGAKIRTSDEEEDYGKGKKKP